MKWHDDFDIQLEINRIAVQTVERIRKIEKPEKA